MRAASWNRAGSAASSGASSAPAPYAPNLALFCVITAEAVYSLTLGNAAEDQRLQEQIAARRGFDPLIIANDTIGIVTVQDGPSLQHGEIVAPSVGTNPAEPDSFHNSFQDTSKFLAAGGRRGRQEQVLVDGTYYINALFATIETIPKTKVELGYVAVVNSYVGADNPEAMTADSGRGRTVPPGCKGIWSKPFEPGKYPINTYAMETQMVPTTNFQLRWIAGATGGMQFDDDLREIPVITKDAFEILLPLSIVAHIAPMSAPHVIQRFSNVTRFVAQTLDPLVSAYFKDATQSRTLLEFINQRQAIQAEALAAMQERLREHRIDIEEVLLGTPRPPAGDTRMDKMLEQLRDRQIANEQSRTYESQTAAATERKKLADAQALADQQPEVTKSLLSIEIAANQGKAEAARQRAAADGTRITADAEAYAATERSKAVGGTEAFLRQFAIETIAHVIREAKVPLVPSVQIEGTSGAPSNIMAALIAAAAAAPSVHAVPGVVLPTQAPV